MEDGIHYVDDDSDSSFGFEIGIANAGGQKRINNDSENSFDRKSSDCIEISDDVHLNDYLNSSGTKRAISTAIPKMNTD